jgi:fumarate hydratase subunit beta
MALLRPIHIRSEKYEYLERSLAQAINRLNIGPQGLGGKTSVLAVNIEASSCHRANLPVAIAFNCHIGRYKTWQYGEIKDTEKEADFWDRLRETAKNIHIFRNYRRVQLPLSEDMISGLNAGNKVLLNGIVYTARDAAHRRLVMMLKEDKALPFDLEGQVIYYVGPTPPKPGHVIGSAGPTTSYRMDPYTPQLLSRGLKGMIGKGYRSPGVIDAIKRYHALYFITFAGAGALLSRHIARSETIAFGDLGTEAIRRLELKDFPAIVACDAEGRDIYKTF